MSDDKRKFVKGLRCGHPMVDGSLCTAWPRKDSSKKECVFHDPSSIEAGKGARRRGGINRMKLLKANFDPHDLAEALTDLINKFAKIESDDSGLTTAQKAGTIGYLIRTLIELKKSLAMISDATDEKPDLSDFSEVELIVVGRYRKRCEELKKPRLRLAK